MGILGAISEFVKVAFCPAGTAIAGAGRTVSAGTFKGNIFRAVRGTVSAVDTFAVVIAFQRHPALMRESSMKFDFFSDGRFIFSNRLSNGSFRRAVGNAGKDNASFLEG